MLPAAPACHAQIIMALTAATIQPPPGSNVAGGGGGLGAMLAAAAGVPPPPPPPPPPHAEAQPAAPPAVSAPQQHASSAPAPRVIFELPKTMDKLRNDVGEWSLADDVGLMMVLEELANSMKSKIRHVEGEVDTLVHETSAVHVSLRNSFTSFSMLSQTQFVENRVYDNDDELIKPGSADAAKYVSAADAAVADANKRHELLVRRARMRAILQVSLAPGSLAERS